MKIGVLEWNVASLGGRQREMLAFADWWTLAGHDVTLYSNWLETPTATYGPDTFQDRTSYLGAVKFAGQREVKVAWLPLERHLTRPFPEWKGLDVLFCSYGSWGHLQKLMPKTKAITWVLHPDQARPDPTVPIWTPTRTCRTRLMESTNWAGSDPLVIPPPHDFSLFRRACRPWAERELDVLVVGTLLDSKRLVPAARMLKDLGLKSLIVGMSCAALKDENERVLAELLALGADVVENATSVVVAKLMGNTKIYLSLSEHECASVCIYEALNAGMWPIVRVAGSAIEQLSDGEYGSPTTCDEGVASILRHALGARGLIVNCDRQRRRGLTFDRLEIGGQSLEALR